MSERDERLEVEAVRLYRRYAVEIVEALNFCPYAEKARVDGNTAERVVSSSLPTDEELLDVVDEVAADESIHIGLVLLPRLELTRAGLGRWVEVLRKAHAARHGGSAVLAIEGFHPDAEADLTHPDRLTPFVRRTPDPTLQLTRLAVLERVRRGTPQGTAFFDPDAMDVHAFLSEPGKRPLHERIAEMNHEMVRSRGVDDVRARMDDILRDRDESYRAIDPSIAPRLGAPPSSS